MGRDALCIKDALLLNVM